MYGNVNILPKVFYYLGMAEAASKRATCFRKQYGAVIVNNDEVVATGHNGAPRGMSDCIKRNNCPRIVHCVPRGTNYHYCRSVHAEANAIVSGGRRAVMHGTLYLYGWDVVESRVVVNPGVCIMCKRLIINSGIDQIIYADPNGLGKTDDNAYGYKVEKVQDWIDADEDLPPWKGPQY